LPHLNTYWFYISGIYRFVHAVLEKKAVKRVYIVVYLCFYYLEQFMSSTTFKICQYFVHNNCVVLRDLSLLCVLFILGP